LSLNLNLLKNPTPSLVKNIAADNMLRLTLTDWNKNFKTERERIEISERGGIQNCLK
jgi:hypothetical protein